MIAAPTSYTLLWSGSVKSVQVDSGHRDAKMVLNRYSIEFFTAPNKEKTPENRVFLELLPGFEPGSSSLSTAPRVKNA